MIKTIQFIFLFALVIGSTALVGKAEKCMGGGNMEIVSNLSADTTKNIKITYNAKEYSSLQVNGSYQSPLIQCMIDAFNSTNGLPPKAQELAKQGIKNSTRKPFKIRIDFLGESKQAPKDYNKDIVFFELPTLAQGEKHPDWMLPLYEQGKKIEKCLSEVPKEAKK